MFAWTTRGKNVFSSFPEELFEQTVVLAANQGLYNSFLAAGLIWTFFIKNDEWRRNVSVFFLSCVSLAGIYAAYSVDIKILFSQGMPALIALLLIFIDDKRSVA
jgi:putative membrane protein